MSLDIQPCPWLLSSHVKQACLPFLRCAALMYHYVTGVASPLELQGLPHFLLKDGISFSLMLFLTVDTGLQMLIFLLEIYRKYPRIFFINSLYFFK